MAYLRNAWYVAAWSDEIGEGLFSRTILEQKIVFFRDAEGKVVAARDICPHRFAPLHMGRLTEEGTLECAYHGLRFNTQGKCVFNPDGAGKIPPGTGLTMFPTAERYQAVWIWMGDPKSADESKIVNLPQTEPRAGWSVIRGDLSVPAHYELITDNLMDLSHVRCLCMPSWCQPPSA